MLLPCMQFWIKLRQFAFILSLERLYVIHILVTSRLDYHHALYVKLSLGLVYPKLVQMVKNKETGMLIRVLHIAHITP